MYVLSHAIAVNPDGVEPKVSVKQLWRGLEMKAENAMPFVNGMTRCDVLERDAESLTRIITFRGADHKERITFMKPIQVTFERLDGTGVIDNTISESPFGLLLTFTFGVSFPGIEQNTEEERQMGETMRGAYIGAVEATLARVRQMVRDGEM